MFQRFYARVGCPAAKPSRRSQFSAVSRYHSSATLSMINRQEIEASLNAFQYLEPLYEISSTKARFAKFTQIIADIRQLPQPTTKEKEVLQFAHMHRASILRELNKYDLARQELYKIEQMAPESPFICGEFGKELTLMGQYSLALRFLTKCITGVGAGSREALLALEGRAGCVLELYVRVKEENPKAVEYQNELLQSARRDIEEVLWHAPEKLSARLEKGKIYSEIDTKIAIQELNTVVNKSNDKDLKGEAIIRLITVYLKTNNTKHVVGLRDQLEKLDPNHPRVLIAKQLVSVIEKKNEEEILTKKKTLEKEMSKEMMEKFYQYQSQGKSKEEIKRGIEKELSKFIKRERDEQKKREE